VPSSSILFTVASFSLHLKLKALEQYLEMVIVILNFIRIGQLSSKQMLLVQKVLTVLFKEARMM